MSDSCGPDGPPTCQPFVPGIAAIGNINCIESARVPISSVLAYCRDVRENPGGPETHAYNMMKLQMPEEDWMNELFWLTNGSC